jgi:hypothetical protein
MMAGVAQPASPNNLDDLVRPLTDPDLDPARRATIERALQREVCRLTDLTRCEALPEEHPLRKAAAALDEAFVAVTNGPVADETLVLPEVSRRSPLAPWKHLVRAIAAFYRGDEAACRQFLEAIDGESAPARLVPAMQAMLPGSATVALTPAAAALRARITRDSNLRDALEELDQAFALRDKRRILKAICPAVDECRHSSPGELESLRQHISVRCAVADLDAGKVRSVLGGATVHDATFLRLLARSMEDSQDPEKVLVACRMWEEFRHAAAKESWFAANGPEAAAICIHIASLLRRIPDEMLRELQWTARSTTRISGENFSYLFPEEMYQRASALDPHPEVFSQWMDWAQSQRGGQADRVAAAWHKIRPRDIEPLLHLLKSAEDRGSFGSALGFLAKVEQIDGLNPSVRGTRLRLLGARALQLLHKKKPWAAEEDLVRITELPEAQQGPRLAFLAALRAVVRATCGHEEDAARCRVEVERVLESRAAAAMLLFAIAARAKQRTIARLPEVKQLSRTDRASLPRALAVVTAIADEMHLQLELPLPWMIEIADRFPANRQALDVNELCTLARSALLGGHADLAYRASAEGLARGGATEPRFLLLRAQSVTGNIARQVVCAKAAAVLARMHSDSKLADEAIELVRGLIAFEHLSLTAEQARDVLQREKAEANPPTPRRPGPDYRDIVAVECQCSTCRRARGEQLDPFGDDVDDDGFDDEDVDLELPPDLPPEVAEVLMDEAKKAIQRGESFEDFMARLMAAGSRPKRRKKGRRR